MFSFGMLPWWLKVVKESTCNAGDSGSIPELGRSPGGGHGNPTPVFRPGESPCTDESGGLQSTGSQRIGHDGATKDTHALLHLQLRSRTQPLPTVVTHFPPTSGMTSLHALPFLLYCPSLPSILDGSINQGASTSDASLNPSSSMLMRVQGTHLDYLLATAHLS